MIAVNFTLFVISSLITRDTFAAIINFFGCLTSWLAIYLLNWSERLQFELKNKLGEEHDDE